ncbi:histone H2B [Clonorchis sinensis]|uniref:Histone H2B n=1 Tax=Clonorchis sinensis TaxID=79923 RepID=G7YFR2_CLOSI|nr:histone H2B [Clonorchis sinensis]
MAPKVVPGKAVKKASKVKVPKDKKKKRRNKESYAICFSKVLRQVHLNAGISLKAMTTISLFVSDIFERVAAEASSLVHVKDDDIQMLLESDFKLGQFLRDTIIPKAVLFFTGEEIADETVEVPQLQTGMLAHLQTCDHERESLIIMIHGSSIISGCSVSFNVFIEKAAFRFENARDMGELSLLFPD